MAEVRAPAADHDGTRWELGSDYHWDPGAFRRASDGPLADWLPRGHRLYGHGKAALTGVLDALGPRRTLHLPSYYCMDTAFALARSADLGWYRELPDAAGPRLDSLRAGPGDLVLAQNLFGRARREVWDDWSAAHPDVVLVEDHTHDPWSDWARTSTADFCMASLRKTLPLPDGAVAWSPRGRPVHPPGPHVDAGSGLKLAAMLLKQAWRQGAAVAKDDFRALQARGEGALHAAARVPPSALTVAALPALDVWRLREVRAHNTRSLASLLGGDGDNRERGWWLLDHGGHRGVPFGMQVLCDSPERRATLRAHLVSCHVFPAVHWPQSAARNSGDAAALDISARLLTLPVDHRCSDGDVTRLAGVLRELARAGPT